MELYIRLGALMEQHGFTNQSMADASGVPLGTVSGIRSGKIANPSFEAVTAMLRAMGESLDAFVGVSPPAQTEADPLSAPHSTEADKRAILCWAGSEISRAYQLALSNLEATIAEQDRRLEDKDAELAAIRKRAKSARLKADILSAIFVLLFLTDLFIRARGWIVW